MLQEYVRRRDTDEVMPRIEFADALRRAAVCSYKMSGSLEILAVEVTNGEKQIPHPA